MSAKPKTKIPLIRRPWFAFLSSMRFAVALLAVLSVASVIGTVLQQNQSPQDYVVKFGPFWAQIFSFLGLYDVYASSWFVAIMLFLVCSTALCLWRNVPPFLREMRSFRLKVTAKSLAYMKHSALLQGSLKADIAARYLAVRGYRTQTVRRDDGSVLVAAKKGSMNKWGYIFAHAAIIVICLGGLVDSNLLLKIGMLSGRIVPDTTSNYAGEFQAASTLGSGNPSFRGNAQIVEGQHADSVFINADKGLLLQKLPFTVELKKFHIDFYDTGMPKDFASDVIITRQDGSRQAATVRVNHPLTVEGVTIYQAGYGDGGSKLSFKSWNLRGSGAMRKIEAVSQSRYPLDLGGAGKFSIEFNDLQVYNVEDAEQAQAQPENESGRAALAKRLSEVRSVRQDRRFANVGPTIRFKLRDNSGQAHEYVNYMLPLEREGSWFFATGERSSADEPYRWLMLPADPAGRLDSFMALRELLLDPERRSRVVEKAQANVGESVRPQFKLATENLLRQFAEGGYVAIDRHIKSTVPAADQQKTGELMYQILYGAINIALDDALADRGLPPIPAGEVRGRFVLNSLDGYTALTRFQSPVLLQMDGYRAVNMSALQMTKSPGALLVYLGSVLLVAGTLFMFYVREKRAWLLFDGNSIRFAMSATRSERELAREFPQHLADLERLASDLGGGKTAK